MTALKGIIAAVITPFRKDGSINEDEFAGLLQFLLKAGVAGMFVSGNAGEFYALSREEKLLLVRSARKALGTAAPLIFGSGCATTAETVALTRAAEAEGADVITLITPYLIKPSEEELYEHFASVLGATRLPVLLYNNPAVTGVSVSIKTAERLLAFENFAGIKDSSGDLALTLDFLRVGGDRLSVFAGRDGLILSTLIHGGAGAVSSVASACPELAVDIYREFAAGRLDAAREAQMKFAKLRQQFSLGTFPAVVKEILSLRGFRTGVPRLPVKPLTPENREILSRVMRDLRLLAMTAPPRTDSPP
ncbi:MAG: dihydrodipicolinate synthase family protein [Treponema sp.]|jgi:4-hydroxy-tetrahydrodipicolinate synthase|nr:dihydrodipicolinate synthase family protein [Treponema sp.]